MNQQIWSAINFTLVDFNIFVAVHTAIWWTIYTTNLFVIHGRVLSLAYCLQLFYSYRTRSWIIVLPHRKTCQQCCPELLTEDCEGFADLYVVAPALWLHPVVFGLHIMKHKKKHKLCRRWLCFYWFVLFFPFAFLLNRRHDTTTS